jgi:hypothetical protein
MALGMALAWSRGAMPIGIMSALQSGRIAACRRHVAAISAGIAEAFSVK